MKSIFRFFTLDLITGIMIVISSCGEEFLIKEPPGEAAGSMIMNPDGVESILVRPTFQRVPVRSYL